MPMATNVHLTPELERFARACVESGQYNSVSEVVRAGLRLLQDAEARRSHLRRLVEEGYASAREAGTVSAEEALRGMDEAIASCGCRNQALHSSTCGCGGQVLHSSTG
jgi:antitoxin ParD1/3/4